MKRIRGKLTYANVMATLALFVALGGVSYAATQLPTNSVGSAQIKVAAVTPAKLSSAAKATLIGPAGASGPPGASGPAGQNGKPGGGGAIEGIPAGGDLSGSYPNPTVLHAQDAEELGGIAAEGFLQCIPVLSSLTRPRALNTKPKAETSRSWVATNPSRTPA